MGALRRDPQACAGLRVGVYGSGGAPWPHAAFAALHGANVRMVRASDILDGRLDEVDVFVVPGGGRQAMHGLLEPLGAEGVAAIRRFVEAGGTYLSSCAGSVLPLALDGAAAELHPLTEGLRLTRATMANPGDATLGGLASPGVGVIRVRVDPDAPLAAGVADEVDLVHYNGPFFELPPDDRTTVPFAWPVAATDRFTQAERFLPTQPVDLDATTFASCVARDAAGALVAEVGRGRAILFGSHPEFGLGPLLLGWSDGAQLLLNALTSVPQRGGPGPTGPMAASPAHPDESVSELAQAVAARYRALADGFARLADDDDAAWLADEAAPQFVGRSARDTWRQTREQAQELATVIAERLDSWSGTLQEADRGWLDDAPRPDQDVGAMGLLQLAEQANAMLQRAVEAADRGPRALAHAYDGLGDHPFHLAVGSYLSAAGLVAGAAWQSAALAADRDRPLGPLASWLFLEGESA